MKPNPGGQLDPSSIVGRDDLICKMWGILEGRSIYMNDLRRVGKTMILNKMHSAPPSHWLAIKRDLGGCHTAAEFATQAFRDSEDLLRLHTRVLRRMSNLLGKLKGTEIAGILKLPDGTAAPWKDVLSRTFSDLQDEMMATDEFVVFLWDEVPFLIDNVCKREGANTAMEILDALRSLGQDYSRVRLVLTGSIGLHHVLTDLRAKGYINSPLNHMERIAPGPLEQADAIVLAENLLAGAGVTCVDSPACAAAVAESVGHVAFYIHKLISRLPKPRKGESVDPAFIERALQKEIIHPDGDWDFEHYRKRLRHYYGRNENLALHILDAIAASEPPLTLDQIRKQVASQTRLIDIERLRELLKLLQQDHYLERDGTGRYAFRFPLVRRWWRFDRSLENRRDE
jgi:hypothetical protein